MQIRAVLLLAGMATLFLAIGSLFGVQGAAVALAIATVMAFWSFWSTPAKLAAMGAAEVIDPKLIAMVRELAARANVPAPRVFEIKVKQPNALALGPHPGAAVLVLTAGLRKQLSKQELSAVLGHELAHIRYRDTLTAAIGMTLLTAIATLALIVGFVGVLVGRNGGGLMVGLAIFWPVLALVLHFAMSRSNEYRADRFSANLTGDPTHLIKALRKLDTAARRICGSTADPILVSVCFVDPTPGSWSSTFFSSHPPIARRIARLEAMRRTMAEQPR